MIRPTLVGRLLRWQISLTVAVCLLLVAAVALWGGLWLRESQDDQLRAQVESLCNGVRSEREEMPGEREAAVEFFREYGLWDHRQEYWSASGELWAARGEPELDGPPVAHSVRGGDCRSSRLGPDRAYLRICARRCAGGATARIATADVLYLPSVRRILAGLALLLAATTVAGALAGRFVFGRLLRPVTQMERAAQELADATDRWSVGVSPPYRELAQLERAFDDLLRRLHQALEREKRFTQEASHELRTPLTAARLRLESLLEARRDDPALRAELERILRNCHSLDRLVGALLILARSDRSDISEDWINLADVVRDAVARQREIHAVRDGRWTVEAPDEVLVQGNEELLSRAVENLLENAQRHAGPDPRVRVALAVENGLARVAVEDDGPGIPEPLRDALFERFRRGASHDREGVGLGLAVVRSVARRHGGRVWVEPAESGGARFSIELPLRRANLNAG